MYVRLRLQSPGLNLETVLHADSLPALVELVQKHRVSDPAALQRPSLRPSSPSRDGHSVRRGRLPSDDEPAPSAEVLSVRQRLAGVRMEDVLASGTVRTFPEKVLLATGWLECHSSSGQRPHQRDVKRFLVTLGHEPPANPGREVRAGWDRGWLDRGPHNSLWVTEAGWAKIADLLGAEGDDPDAACAVP